MTETQQTIAGFLIVVIVSLFVPMLIIYGVVAWVFWGFPPLSELHPVARLVMLIADIILTAGSVFVFWLVANKP